MLLGHLARQKRFPLRSKDLGQLVDETRKSHWGIKKDKGNIDPRECPESGLAGGAPGRQEALEMKPAGREPGDRQGSQDGGRTRYGRDPEAGLMHGRDEPATRIAQKRRSRIRNQGQPLAPYQALDQKGNALLLIVGMAGDEWYMEVEVSHELAGVAGILGHDPVRGTKDLEGTWTKVIQLADRGRDNGQLPRFIPLRQSVGKLRQWDTSP
jgi:hypothetical protein